jgi:ABC-type Fe3+ transport system permease subunit
VRRTLPARVAALVAAALLLVSSSAWLLFALWLATDLDPCPLDGDGPCDRPTTGTVVLGAGVVLPGGLAGLALAWMAVRYAVRGRFAPALPYALLVASVSFAIAMVWLAGASGR